MVKGLDENEAYGNTEQHYWLVRFVKGPEYAG